MFQPYAYAIVEYRPGNTRSIKEGPTVEQRELNRLGEQGYKVISVVHSAGCDYGRIIWTLERSGLPQAGPDGGRL